ncbi:Putative prophage CPS-53 integrase [Budvicia aquatica]|uniref:Prophage CPS-53 integrase n=1 Tax=Budvicia aquatica TaxID=82979 RepID=A0A484ZHB0_9GAMM|nr:Putative prophage CPS-53 integrase [Budvicia aquatica]
MALTDLQIKRAKPREKAYTLNDGMGLSLLVEPGGGKGWRFRYRFAGKAKLISLGTYATVSLGEARLKRDEARRVVSIGSDPSEMRKEEKRLQTVAIKDTFEAIAREWHGTKNSRWSERYSGIIMRDFENDIFPFIGKRPIAEIKPMELLEVLRRIEKRCALEQLRKVRQRCGEVFRYAVITGRASYNPAPDLASALTPNKTNHFPHLKADELPNFLRGLSAYSGAITKLATKFLMLTGVRTQECDLPDGKISTLSKVFGMFRLKS